MQERYNSIANALELCNSIANALELCLSCTNPSQCSVQYNMAKEKLTRWNCWMIRQFHYWLAFTCDKNSDIFVIRLQDTCCQRGLLFITLNKELIWRSIQWKCEAALLTHLPLGWGLLSQFSPFRYFPNFSASQKYMLAMVYHVHIWQVLPQPSCGDTCQIWMWYK